MSGIDTTKRIILNGDDFGYSPSVNQGIIEAIDHGILTSTSVMVHRPAAHEAKQLVARKDISVGLHLDMTEEGIHRWLGLARLFATPSRKIEREFKDQIKKFESITGQLPHHIDGHHNVHLHPKVKPFVVAYARENQIPVRGLSPAKFVMSFFGRSVRHWNDPSKVSPENLIKIMDKLPPGTYEIMCHPGYVDHTLIASGTTYLHQRSAEITALTDKNVALYVTKCLDIKLISWQDIKV